MAQGRTCEFFTTEQTDIKGPSCRFPRSRFKEDKVCGICAKSKHVKSSFKFLKVISTSHPLELLHMDLCGSMGIQSRGGRRYVFMIIDDYFIPLQIH